MNRKEFNKLSIVCYGWVLLLLIASIFVLAFKTNAVTLLMVPQGGTGAGTFTAGHVLQGNGTGVIQGSALSGDATLAVGGALTISANAIEESMLKAVDAPADEECFTYESTTGDFEWQSCAAASSDASTVTVEGKATETIAKGQAVYISGAVGNNVQFSLADNLVDGKTNVAGMATEAKTSGQTLSVRHVGQLDDFDTSSWAAGDNLYLSTSGSLTSTIPTSGAILHVAYVEYSHASLGDVLLHVCGDKDIGAPASVDLFKRMGDSAGTNKISYRDYANNEIANVDSDGNAYFGGSMGIGIMTPAQLLHMQGNGTAAQGWARFGLSSTEYTEVGHKGNNSAINAVGDGNLDFRHDSVTKASLTDAGVFTATTFSGALSGNATTATALASNGANCGAGNYPLGVDASGAVESCTDATTEINSVVNALGGTGLTCAAQSCSVDLGTAIDISTETNLTAGRSLTLTGDDVLADSELYHHEKCLYFEDPTAADDFKSLFHFRKAATITGMWCESDQTVNMDLQLDDGTPADINGTDLVCDSTPADDTSMGGDTGAAAGERLDLAITSVSGTPTWVSICFDFTYDD